MTPAAVLRALVFALAALCAAAPAAEAGEASPRALRRDADAQARALAAAMASLAKSAGEAQALESERVDLAARRTALDANAIAAQSLSASDRAALERALAGLALAERNAASPAAAAAAPAVAGLAVHWASRASDAAVAARDAAQASLDLAAKDAAIVQRIAALDDARRSLAAAAETARRARATLLAQAEAAERAAEQRRRARTAVARASAPAGIPWRSPVQAVRLAPGDHPSAVRIHATPGAVVRAPVDGKISYAGLFRTYGQVLILDAPGGYAFVLSGLDRIHAATGQVVRAGDPLGALAPGGDSADLGLEVRKNGKPLPSDRWLKDEIKPRKGVTIAERRKTGPFQEGTRRE